MVLICGIDEAGRGPVIGPLVITGVLIKEKDIDRMIAFNVKDSKLLTPSQRESIYKKLISFVKYKTVIIKPQEIDDVLESNDLNLNWLEAIKIAEIINELKPDKVFIDCPSTNINAYKKYVKKLLTVKTDMILSHKADAKYPIVGAASIISKVRRDNEIKKIKKKIGMDFGSGYPSDETTQRFLKKYWNKYPKIFRKSWASYKNVENLSKQMKLGEF
jgi:ribonuclease HII